MPINPIAINLRAKKLGLLIKDARIASRRTISECASAIGANEDEFNAYETGQRSPSITQVELLAYYLDIPIDHFWGRISRSESVDEHRIAHMDQLLAIRQRMVGALLRQVRTKSNLSAKEVFEKTGIPEEKLQAYERGEQDLPLPTLEALITALGGHVDLFMDQSGPVGMWRKQQQAARHFLELPEEMRDFIGKPVNRPYLELARRLSDLSVEKLRAVAEGLLEITY